MEFDKLFKVVVLGGSVIAGGCAPKASPTPDTVKAATKTTEESPKEDEEANKNEGTVDCEKVCDGPEGRERTCPDPNNDGFENCCWLMGPKLHGCCSE